MSLNVVSRRSAWRTVVGFARRRVVVPAAFLSLGLGGCATGGGGDVAVMATIAGGQKIRVPLGRNGVELTEEEGVKINTATFTLNAAKKIVFVFEFTDSRRRALRSVRVEDVADEAPVLLVESAQPKLSTAGQWRGESEPLALSDRPLSWMATLPNSVRVFRFTLTFADGQKLILHQGALFPAAMKSAVRQSLGQNY